MIKHHNIQEVLAVEDKAKTESSIMLYDCYRNKSYKGMGFKTWDDFLDSLPIEKRNVNFRIQVIEWTGTLSQYADWFKNMPWACLICLVRVMNAENAQYFVNNITSNNYCDVKTFCDEYQVKITTE